MDNEYEENDRVFYKKKRNREKFTTIYINGDPVKVLGFRRKMIDIMNIAQEYFVICPLHDQERYDECEIIIEENFYKRVLTCRSGRSWFNYHEYVILKEKTVVHLDLSDVENFDQFYEKYSTKLELPFFGCNLDAFYDSTWGIAFVPDEIHLLNIDKLIMSNGYKKFLGIVNIINSEENTKIIITNNM